MKHCSNCKHSYEAFNFSGKSMGQHCNSTDYNSEDYTNTMIQEDWGKGHCRFWEEKQEVVK